MDCSVLLTEPQSTEFIPVSRNLQMSFARRRVSAARYHRICRPPHGAFSHHQQEQSSLYAWLTADLQCSKHFHACLALLNGNSATVRAERENAQDEKQERDNTLCTQQEMVSKEGALQILMETCSRSEGTCTDQCLRTGCREAPCSSWKWSLALIDAGYEMIASTAWAGKEFASGSQEPCKPKGLLSHCFLQ